MKKLLFACAVTALAVTAFAQTSTPSRTPIARPTPRPIAGWLIYPATTGSLSISGTSFATRPLYDAGILGANLIVVTGSALPTMASGSLAVSRAAKIAALQAQYSGLIAAGITVTSGTVSMTLAARESDQNAFTRLVSVLNTASMPATITLSDMHGVPYAVPVATVYALLGSYGQQCAALWSDLVNAKAAARSAPDAAALAAVAL